MGGAITFINGAVTFVGEGSLAVERSFKTAVTFVGRGGSAIGGRGEASGACTDRAYTGKASADGDCVNGAGVNKVFNS